MKERPVWLPPQRIKDPNRAARRSASRNEVSLFEQEILALGAECNRNNEIYMQVFKDRDQRLGRIIYEGEPVIYGFMHAFRNLHEFLGRAEPINSKRPFVANADMSHLESSDLMALKIGGTSIADIEQMPLPLVIDDIKRINRMMRRQLLFDSGKKNSIRTMMTFLATKSLITPNKFPDLLPLNKRLTEYFDYYTNLMTNFTLNDKDEVSFLKTVSFCGSYLIRALGCYIPARLNITPGSAIKLYHQRAESSAMPNFAWSAISRWLSDESQHAFVKNGLPEDLVNFGRYDKQKDDEAATILLKHYQGKIEDNGQIEELAKSADILGRLDSNRNFILREIRHSSDRRLKIEMKEDSVVSSVTVTSQNRETLIFILHFGAGQSYLTLEVDKNNNLYGVPPKLAREDPHLADLLVKDVIGQVLEKVAPEPVVTRPRISEPVTIHLPVEEVEESEENFRIAEKEHKEKRKRMKRDLIIATVTRRGKEPELPAFQEPPKRTFNVIHSRKMVHEQLGKKSRPDDVDRIMGVVRRFEFGHVPAKTIKSSDGRLKSIRAGDLRVILNHLGGSTYSIEAIKDREEAYETTDSFKGRS